MKLSPAQENALAHIVGYLNDNHSPETILGEATRTDLNNAASEVKDNVLKSLVRKGILGIADFKEVRTGKNIVVNKDDFTRKVGLAARPVFYVKNIALLQEMGLNKGIAKITDNSKLKTGSYTLYYFDQTASLGWA